MEHQGVIWFTNSLKAWEKLNEAFIRNDGGLHAECKSKALYVYDLVIGIEKPDIGEFDFGKHFNYTISKWRSLVSNYIDYDKLDSVKKEVLAIHNKGGKIYNIALQFDNKHGHGKNCLLSMVFSNRVNGDDKPVISVFLRASEVTKRLICDLLLFQRIGEYVYGNNDFKLVIHFNQIFNDDTVLLMYHAHKDVNKVLRKCNDESRKKELSTRLNHMLTCDPKTVKYKVHLRALKVLRPEIYKYPVTLATKCKL